MGNAHTKKAIKACSGNNTGTNATKERKEEILAKIYHSKVTEVMPQRELPEDMIIEILSRLPTKSLMQFKCVCKRWYELSSSSTFIDIHLNNNMRKRKGFIFCSINSDLTSEDNMAIFVSANKTTTNLRVPMFSRDLFIVGSSNGLVCLLSYQGDYTLWNPATKQCQYLPKLISQGNNTLRKLGILFSISGFVFDPTNKDYKVVKIIVWRDGDKGIPQVNLFTLNSSSWRTINFRHRFGNRIPYSKSVIVNKYIYWMELLLEEEINLSRLRCFDMVEEDFREIEVPCDLQGFTSNLDVYRGSLAIFVSKHPFDNFDMWVMNNHFDGTNYSWIKQVSVGSVPFITIEPIGFWIKDEDELLVFDTTGHGPKNLFTFHPVTREIKKFMGDHPADQIFPYSESLVRIPKLN